MNTRLSEFMGRIASETYPEPESAMHTEFTQKAFAVVEQVTGMKPGWWALDVGCGQGPALREFLKRGITATGIALNEEDVRVCYDLGFAVHRMDQNDMSFRDGSFDIVWARHVLEHSVAPLWTLTEFNRVLKAGGWLYAEMPSPDTACMHHLNKNHYSVLGWRAWHALIQKAGFEVVNNMDFEFTTPAGPDRYFGFICRK